MFVVVRIFYGIIVIVIVVVIILFVWYEIVFGYRFEKLYVGLMRFVVRL